MLIIGGLAAVALVALVGVILLSRAEERAEKAQQEHEKATALLSQQPASTQQTPPSSAVAMRPTGHSTGKLMPLNKEVTLSDLNGQLYEVTDALLLLAQRVGELELRLGDLATTFERRETSGVTEVTEITDHEIRMPNVNTSAHS